MVVFNKNIKVWGKQRNGCGFSELLSWPQMRNSKLQSKLIWQGQQKSLKYLSFPVSTDPLCLGENSLCMFAKMISDKSWWQPNLLFYASEYQIFRSEICTPTQVQLWKKLLKEEETFSLCNSHAFFVKCHNISSLMDDSDFDIVSLPEWREFQRMLLLFSPSGAIKI